MGELQPLLHRELEDGAFLLAKRDHLGHRLRIGLEPRLRLPGVEEGGHRLVEHGLDGHAAVRGHLPVGRLELVVDAGAVQPDIGAVIGGFRYVVQLVATDVFRAESVQTPQNRQGRRLAARQIEVRGPQDEGLVALVAVAVQEGRGLRVGAGHDESSTAITSS